MGLFSFGSGNSSKSSTTNNNTTIDGRQVTGAGGSAIANYGTAPMNVSILDGGAIAGALDLAKSGRELANKEFGEVLNASKWFFEKATAETTKNMQETLSNVGGIYQQARETELSKDVQGSKQLLQVVGFIVVGMVALAAFKKGGV